ncbi:MAG TPA: helix-turn-helix transcriptional regulator [Thermoanaerobaculia bacterium]|nr:helix-turn-helix transcriptional regulator [Thermoanaerobaculia bacterium]
MPNTPARWPSELELAQVLGSRVKTLREARGLSQRALSQQLRISKSMVTKYEGGLHAPTVTVLVRLAALFEVTLDSLLGRDVRDPRLMRCLLGIEAMDEPSRIVVIDAIEAIVNAYRMLFERGAAAEPR